MKTWLEAFRATWLADKDTATALDGWVQRTLAEHRGLGDDVHALESVAPWSVATLARSIGAFDALARERVAVERVGSPC